MNKKDFVKTDHVQNIYLCQVLFKIDYMKINENKSIFAAFRSCEWRSFTFTFGNEVCVYDGELYNSIKNMYDDNKSSILLNNLSTDWFNVTSGVKKGDILYPILCSLFINELALGVKNFRN